MMSFFEQLCNKFGEDGIKPLYTTHFPFEVRKLCSPWLEQQLFSDQFIDINRKQKHVKSPELAIEFLAKLIHQLQKYAENGMMNVSDPIDNIINIYTQRVNSSVSKSNFNQIYLFKFIFGFVFITSMIMLYNCINTFAKS